MVFNSTLLETRTVSKDSLINPSYHLVYKMKIVKNADHSFFKSKVIIKLRVLSDLKK